MFGDDLFDVCLAMEFDVVSGLVDVYTIESLDDAQVVERILHVYLELVTYSLAYFFVLGGDNEVINLSEEYDKIPISGGAVVHAGFVCGSGEVHIIFEDFINMFVP